MSKNRNYIIGITLGDPCGIGPEITLKALEFYQDRQVKIVIYGLFPEKLKPQHIQHISNINDVLRYPNDYIFYYQICEAKIIPGQPSEKSGEIAYKTIEQAGKHALEKKLDAIVTAPLSKYYIQLHHPEFIGHTEFFADQAKIKSVVMSFFSPYLNVALLTTHTPLKILCDNLSQSKDIITRKIEIINECLIHYFGIKKPKLAMLGVNPHSGERGAFGNEEIEILQPIITKLKRKGIDISGPFPADTYFAKHFQNFDITISTYHDQALIPFKMLAFNEGVNVTLGLPYIRTSVDHGTAFDIAGKDIASPESLAYAIKLAKNMLINSSHLLNIHKKTAIIDNTIQPYTYFSQVYDEYFNTDPKYWGKFLMDIYYKHRKRKPDNILELACGTGKLADYLQNQGYNIIATDINIAMLQLAKKQFPSLSLKRLDMKSFQTEDKYNLIFSMFDSVNYLQNKSELLSMLCSVYQSLHWKGIFIFDISTLKNSADNFDGYQSIFNKDDLFVHRESEYNRQNNVLTSKLTLFRKENVFYKRYEEEHRQMTFFTKDIIKMIKQANLNLIGIYNFTSTKNILKKYNPLKMKEFDKIYNRLFFLCEKDIKHQQISNLASSSSQVK